MSNDSLQITFIGAGNMASSLIHGLLDSGVPGQQITAADPADAQLAKLQTLGVNVTSDNAKAVSGADAIVLATKPQLAGIVLEALPNLQPKQLVISIAAGINIDSLQAWLPNDQPIVRCMPNTPALVNAGITGLFANPHVSAQQRADAGQILDAVGSSIWVDEESQIDAVTAVSGSGPAYFFLLMESMIEAGQTLGLSAEVSHTLAVQTARGAALMACQKGADPSALRQGVTSKGGTTAAALAVMQSQGLPKTVAEALLAAKVRAEELAVEFGVS